MNANPTHPALAALTIDQLHRLYRRAETRMQEGDGYQPFGYDWITIRTTKPGWFRALQLILHALREREHLSEV